MAMMKVWGGLAREQRPDEGKRPRVQARTVVRASSKKQALVLLASAGIDITMHEFDNYWGLAGAGTTEAIAEDDGEGVWQSASDYLAKDPVYKRLV